LDSFLWWLVFFKVMFGFLGLDSFFVVVGVFLG